MNENNYTRDEKIEIANTIIDQMGGYRRLSAMVGIKDHCALDAGLQFGFKGSRKINKVSIELNAMDTYNVKFFKIPTLRSNCGPKALDKYFEKIEICKTPVAEFDNLYCDQLVDTFEQTTGLDLHF